MTRYPGADLVSILFVRANVLGKNTSMRWVVLAALFTLGFSCDSFASEDQAEEKRLITDEQASQELKERREFITSFKQKLDSAKTSEEKRVLIDEFRQKQQVYLKQRTPTSREEKTVDQRVAEMKAQAQGNPEMLARVTIIEERLKSVELIKEKLRQANVATGEEKQQLLDEVRREQTKMSQARQAEMEARLQEAKAREVQDARELPPEMAAVKAKSEARKREVEQLKEALGKASPEERAKLLDEWRKKRQEEMAAMRAQMERIQ